ncbi:MFS family permease [Arthrobacter globiformis]|nr:MFS family permease [Arthrobacter globiformis]
MPLPRALRPFSHREYRVLIRALAISIFGSGMWAVAMVYQVIHIGGGPLELSLVAAAGSVGLVAFVLAGGIAADRVPQRLLIIAVEGTNLAVIATVSGLAMAGWLQLWHLVAGAFILGVGAAFFFPAYSAILPRILRRRTCWRPTVWKGPCVPRFSRRPVLLWQASSWPHCRRPTP